ncbi:MAG: hypothetical protein RBU21_00125 [FCB group bacterium]|jgi:hypothetical protein|nr:hypothetical protein [FCB group bacterium]
MKHISGVTKPAVSAYGIFGMEAGDLVNRLIPGGFVFEEYGSLVGKLNAKIAPVLNGLADTVDGFLD